MRRYTRSAITLIAVFLLLGLASPSRAQGYVAPLIGYDFGGNAGCPHISNCTDKRTNIGVAFGSMGKIIGFEEEFADAKNFFGEVGTQKSSVLTAMSNIMVVPAIGPVHPYLLFGLGLMKTHVDFNRTDVLNFDSTGLAWDTGAGITLLFGHIGVRADLRHFHSTKSLAIPFVGTTPSEEKLSFGRISGALVLAF
jgi:hypothetical protein